MLLGADTLVPVSQNILDLVKQRFGTTPLMWGRYFKRPDFAEDFQPAAENTYMAGWVDGFREWNTRVMGSECCGTR